ncbi:hypothetical protein JKA74_12995 [Marivirga sp. S37H4]|uniref:Uncharacterized protein n=1 Tax=Marivirga aurantiaca TaxID=2802615 RepID=A0A934WZW9_9BACT|nr:DUF6428 family protein [Marivirga aurantiaca]MBK6265952.1 hypothetical protein [Marivirga aurantiaca]
MKLVEVKSKLAQLDQVTFQLPDGSFVPPHFHVTEVGAVTKKFIDCGGTIRQENSISFQLWEAGDFDHRIGAQKLIDIISLSERKLGLENWEVEVEYQDTTIGKYELDFNGTGFVLTNTQTDCLAKDKCGIPESQLQGKPRIKLADMTASGNNACTPDSGCC